MLKLNFVRKATDGPRKFRSLTKVFVKQRNFVQSDRIENDKTNNVKRQFIEE